MSPRIEIVTSVERFRAVRASWDKLWSSASGDVFRCHGWLLAWMAGSVRGVVPHVALTWRDNELVAALPLVIRRRYGLRVLQWCAQPMNDYCDALVLPGNVTDVAAMWDTVWRSGGFDLLDLRQVRPDAAIRRCLEAIPGAPPSRQHANGTTRCVAIDCIQADGEAWFRSLGKKGRNNFWRGERILAELGGAIEYHCLDPATRPIDAELKRLIELKHAWVRASQRSSPLLLPEGKPLEAMLHAAAESGRLRLFMLTAGETLAAASVNFVQGDTLQAYMTSYDPAFERASPGMLLIVHYVRWAYDHGLARVDLLRGDEPFKVKLATSEIGLHNFSAPKSLVGHLSDMAKRRHWPLGLSGPRDHAATSGPHAAPNAALTREG